MLDISFDVQVISITASILIVGTMLYLDYRRNRAVANGHRKAIAFSILDLNTIITQIMLNVDDLDRDDTEAVSDRLNQFLTKNYNHIEYQIININMHSAMFKMSEQEKKDMEKAVSISRWILDTYCPLSIPAERRSSIWKSGSHSELHNNAEQFIRISSKLEA